MTSCGYTPTEIDEMTLFDIFSLFAYWRASPPTNEILKCIYLVEQKSEQKTTRSDMDPSGIGSLITRFPDGFVRSNINA